MGTGNENIQPGPQEKNHNKTRHDQTNFKPKIEKREQANPTILSRARTSDNSDVYKQKQTWQIRAEWHRHDFIQQPERK